MLTGFSCNSHQPFLVPFRSWIVIFYNVLPCFTFYGFSCHRLLTNYGALPHQVPCSIFSFVSFSYKERISLIKFYSDRTCLIWNVWAPPGTRGCIKVTRWTDAILIRRWCRGTKTVLTSAVTISFLLSNCLWQTRAASDRRQRDYFHTLQPRTGVFTSPALGFWGTSGSRSHSGDFTRQLYGHKFP